ncbi:MAG: tetratricopeptide repeat protein [Marinilabiliaceae bacterium]|nr:tetratricopeptide repeat protein [Marinilabiliaceae bacterium]
MRLVGVFILMFCFAMSILSQTPMVNRLMNEGKQQQERNDFKAAVETYEKVLSLEPKKEEARFELAYSWYKLGNNDNALKYGRTVMHEEGEFWLEALILCGSAYDNKGESRRAISLYNRGIRKRPNHPLLHYNMALSQFNLGKLGEAEQHARLSLSLDMGHPSGHLLLSNIMLQKNERVKSMMSLYYYLLMEQDADRSIKAWDMLNAIWDYVLKQSGRSASSDYYQAFEADLVKQAKSESRKLDGIDQFVSRTGYFLEYMPQMVDNNDFWQQHYVMFFKQMAVYGFAHPFAYYVSGCKYKPEALVWMSANNQLFEQFIGWMNQQ